MVDPGVMDMKCITFPYVDNMILTHFLMNLEYKKALKMYITILRYRPKLGSFLNLVQHGTLLAHGQKILYLVPLVKKFGFLLAQNFW